MTGQKMWVVAIAIFLLHQLLQKILRLPVPIADQYLDPFLSMPILLGAFTFGNPLLGIKIPIKQLKAWEIGCITLAFAILFEEGFPAWSGNFHKDLMDYPMYFSGAIVFYFWMNDKN